MQGTEVCTAPACRENEIDELRKIERRKTTKRPHEKTPAETNKENFKKYGIKLSSVSKTTNPLSAKKFRSLPKAGDVDPNSISTMQVDISRGIRKKGVDGKYKRIPLEETVRDILDGKSIDPIRIAMYKRKTYALDHQRLIAHRIAGRKVKYSKATQRELDVALENEKYSTVNEGTSIVIRDVEE